MRSAFPGMICDPANTGPMAHSLGLPTSAGSRADSAALTGNFPDLLRKATLRALNA